jgi:two-component system KDP operon response regulator KdpE
VKRVQGQRILVIDDDPGLLQLVEFAFTRVKAHVYTASSGQDGLRQFYQHRPHLVILDLMMPEMDGLEVCRQIRQLSEAPLIILTALNQEDYVIKGLACGADDYLTKPFNPEVLVARAQAILRRTVYQPGSLKKSTSYSDGYLTVDLSKHLVLVRGRPVRLTATEYRLLSYLVQHPNRVLATLQILHYVWGGNSQDNTEYVQVYIRQLRRKLEANPNAPVYILTEHGIGYRFETQSSQDE